MGLAAPQVGKALRLMLVCPSGAPGDETVVLNPEILLFLKNIQEIKFKGFDEDEDIISHKKPHPASLL